MIRLGVLILSCAAIAALFAGCNQPRSHVVAVSPSGPTIPENLSTITVTFDRAMKTSTINSTTFVIMGSESGKHNGTFTFPRSDQARFNNTTAFVPGENVSMVLNDDIESNSDKKLRDYVRSYAVDAGTPADPDEFELVETEPTAESVAVDPYSELKLTFSEVYDPFTVAETTVRVTGERSGVRVVNFENRFGGTPELILDSVGAYLAGERVHVCVLPQVESLEGLSAEPASIAFTIANEGTHWPEEMFAGGSAGAATFVLFLDVDQNGRDEWVFARETGELLAQQWETAGVGEPIAAAIPAGISAAAAGDFNGDGYVDLVCLSGTGTTLHLYAGGGEFSAFFGSKLVLELDAFNARSAFARHLDEDGIHDLLLVATDPAAAGTRVLWGSLEAPLAEHDDYPDIHCAGSAASCDIDGDRLIDLAYPEPNGSAAIAWGSGERVFGAPIDLEPTLEVDAVLVANVNEDDLIDLLVAGEAQAHCTISISTGKRTFDSVDVDASLLNSRTAVADWDGDGHLDFITPRPGQSLVDLVAGDGSGAFEFAESLSTLTEVTRVTFGDVDGDGRLDVGLAGLDGSHSIGLGAEPSIDPPPPPPAPENLFRIPDFTGGEGEAGVEFVIECDHESSIDAFTIAFAVDPTVLTVESLTTDGTDAGDLGVEWEAANLDSTAGEYTFAMIFDFSPPFLFQELVPANGDSICAGTIAIADDTGGTTEDLVLANGLGSPSTDNIIVDDGETFEVELEDGTLTITVVDDPPPPPPPDEPEFVRGDASGDGAVNVADSIFLNGYFFSDGPEPTCMDAADANDGGDLDIADSTYLLSYIFSDGPAPPAPFPDAGVDPTDDALGCE